MQITVIIPSRGRVRGLSTVLTCLDRLASGKHQITYVVACDDDDPNTKAFCDSLKGKVPVVAVQGPRPQSLGGLVNQMALKYPAEVYTALCDDLLICLPLWDIIIATAVEKTPHGVFWWKNIHPIEATYGIVTEKWRAAAGGIFTNYYPFWFDDLDLLEQWMLTTDMHPIVLDCVLYDKPDTTMRMRDLHFWREFFIATRELRKLKSFGIAEKLGLPRPEKGDGLAKRLSIGLERASVEKLKAMEEHQGEKGPPDASYIKAKQRASELMQDLINARRTP